MRSDLKLDMFVSDIKLVDSSYVKAAKQSEDKTLVNGKYVYTYNYISYINPTANMAYVKSQTKSASSKIESFTDFGKPAIASGMLAVDTEASMSGIDDIILKARVTAGDGKTQDYTLMIQKASSELGIDKVYVDATGGLLLKLSRQQELQVRLQVMKRVWNLIQRQYRTKVEMPDEYIHCTTVLYSQ